MLYKISERDENAYSEQVQNSKSKNICAFYFDIFTILKLFSCFGAFDEKCRFKSQHSFPGLPTNNSNRVVSEPVRRTEQVIDVNCLSNI